MEGKQEFDIVDEDAKQLGFAFIFAKYVLPYVIGAIILAAIAYFVHTHVQEIELKPEYVGAGAILVLILVLITRK